MSEDKEAFLDRWSRLKREQPEEEKPAVQPANPVPAAPLPPVEELKPDSDFKPFMDPRVGDETRRSALKKLFSDAHFNVPDPYEAYSEDYTKSEPIPAKMLKAINRVRDVAIRGEEKAAAEERLAEQAREQARAESAPAQSSKGEPKDVAGGQDT